MIKWNFYIYNPKHSNKPSLTTNVMWLIQNLYIWVMCLLTDGIISNLAKCIFKSKFHKVLNQKMRTTCSNFA